MQTLNRRHFLSAFFAIPITPIIGGSFLVAQNEPQLTRKELNDQVLQLAIAASRVPCHSAFTALIMLSAALDVNAEDSLTDHLIKWRIPSMEGGAK